MLLCFHTGSTMMCLFDHGMWRCLRRVSVLRREGCLGASPAWWVSMGAVLNMSLGQYQRKLGGVGKWGIWSKVRHKSKPGGPGITYPSWHWMTKKEAFSSKQIYIYIWDNYKTHITSQRAPVKCLQISSQTNTFVQKLQGHFLPWRVGRGEPGGPRWRAEEDLVIEIGESVARHKQKGPPGWCSFLRRLDTQHVGVLNAT